MNVNVYIYIYIYMYAHMHIAFLTLEESSRGSEGALPAARGRLHRGRGGRCIRRDTSQVLHTVTPVHRAHEEICTAAPWSRWPLLEV